MINREDLQRRTFFTPLNGTEFLTDRSHTVTVGTTQYIYLGFAYPGSGENDPVWLIKRIALFEDGSTATLFANGLATFNQVWTDHATLNYI